MAEYDFLRGEYFTLHTSFFNFLNRWFAKKGTSSFDMIQIERNDIFNLAFGFVTETSENIFLTGKAGTGKTTFLKYLKEHCAKNVVIAAPTGVAAINAGGVTLHSLFQLPFHPFLPTTSGKNDLLGKLKINKQRQQLLRKMELLVIDEISMVRADVMDAIDTILRSVRRKFQTPFGGVQLLCIGDLFQLPPVAQNHEWNLLQEYYPSRFFFDSMVIREQMPLLIELNVIYRQKEDSFVRLLNKVRNNNMDEDDFEDLHMRYIPGFRPERDESFITLTSHNNQADQINTRELERLFTGPFSYSAEIMGDFPEHLYPAEANLVLKEGAQVMFLKNDAVERKYFNGKIGVVKTLETDKIVVEADGNYITVAKDSWENSRYSLNKADGKLEQEVMGSFTQYPLRLAWAITIHKSQGLTFDKVMIDAGSAFSSGQVYVALSRCTSLDGIVLLSKIPSSAILSNEEVVKGQQALTHRGSLAERFEGARQVFTQQLLEDIFAFDAVYSAVQSLVNAVKKEKNKFNPEGIDWLLAFDHHFLAVQSVGKKFIGHIYTMMKEEPVIEKNGLLQKRISDAAHHFDKELTILFNSIKAHTLVTEHKEAADEVNETLLETVTGIYTVHYYILYCKEAFSIASFLKHKLLFSLQKFNISCYASGKKPTIAKAGIPNFELFETLKRWRDMVCDDTGMAIYMIANQQTLVELATYLPFNKKDLLKISGFGKAKVDKYGDDVLEAINDYCVQYNLVTNITAKSLEPAKEKRLKPKNTTKTDTKLLSLELYQMKKSIEEVAKERQLTVGTVEGHLSYFIGTGNLDIKEFVSVEKQQLITEAIKIHGSLSHKTLIENLPENISYGQIKMVLALQPTP